MNSKNFSKKAVMAALESKGFSVSVGSDDCEENIHLNIGKFRGFGPLVTAKS